MQPETASPRRRPHLSEAREVSRITRMEKRRQRIEAFADLIADGHTVMGAAGIMGISTATATNYMRAIRDGMEKSQ